ncbi:MAG: class II fructose-bisphosphatase [Nanoarchaeota archaeon]
MEKNLALEFVRITEAAAISASKHLGKGDKIKCDQAAVDAMRNRFNYVDFKGRVVIGEGEKDKAPMLFVGEKLGTGTGPEMDIAIDPLECTSNLAKGKPNSISVLAAGPKDSLLNAPGSYMDQIAVGPQAKGVIDITLGVKENLANIAKALGKNVKDLTVCLLERSRHDNLIKELRSVGSRVRLIEHGTISAGIAPALHNSGIDVMMGIGGAPEGVITAAALQCVGGDIQGILKPHNDIFINQAKERGIDLEKVYKIDDLAKGENLVFAATGISDGPLLKGVVFTKYGFLTHSIVMRAKSGTIRYIETHHHESKKR